MRKKDVKIGMKVVPFKKSIDWNIDSETDAKNALSKSTCWTSVKNTKRPYLFVKEIKSEEGFEYFLLGERKGKRGSADFFLFSDFKPYKDR